VHMSFTVGDSETTWGALAKIMAVNIV